MKVIDLLNKIANGEELPKKIIADDNIYYYDETDSNDFYRYRTMANELLTDYADLTDEVEIIEDTPNKIEKIGLSELYGIEFNEAKYAICGKINEIIDFINRKND